MYFHPHGGRGCHDGRHAMRGGWGGNGRGWHGRGFGGGREGRGAGGRSPRMFDGGELRLVLLKLIADEPRHGYDLIREIETLTGGAYAPSPGVVYPTLTMLDDMGFIAQQESEGAKKAFAVTDPGKAELEQNAELVAALLARLRAIGEQQARVDSTSVRRAIVNLRAVLANKLGGHRLDEDALDEETIHQIVALIDEAAQKIERL